MKQHLLECQTLFPFSYLLDKPQNRKGVYAILNTQNGKFYIGSSNSISHRLSQHFYDLRHKKSRNDFMQKSYNNNPQSFFGVVICYTDNLREEEQRLLDVYYDNQIKCYNLSNTANFPYPRENKLQFLREKAKKMHQNNPQIRLALVAFNKTPQARHNQSEIAKQQRLDPEFTVRLTSACREKLKKFHNIDLISPSGEIVKIGWNLREFCRKNNLDRGCLSQLLRGKAKSHKGWKIYT